MASDNEIHSTSANVDIGYAVDECLEKYALQDEDDMDIDVAVWAWTQGVSPVVVVWRQPKKNRHTIIKGAPYLKAIQKFMNGASARVARKEVTWDGLSQEEKDFLLKKRYVVFMTIESDMEIRELISELF